MKSKFVQLYSDIALRVAQLSWARRLKVGAIVVKDNRIISLGYNGMPAGWDNNCEEETYDNDGFHITLTTRPEVLHAESNCLAKIARSHESADGADIFITHSPCIECAKLIYQSGISRVYFGDHYRSDAGIQFLKQSNIEVIRTGE
jgi:dCMP deaminase